MARPIFQVTTLMRFVSIGPPSVAEPTGDFPKPRMHTPDQGACGVRRVALDTIRQVSVLKHLPPRSFGRASMHQCETGMCHRSNEREGVAKHGGRADAGRAARR